MIAGLGSRGLGLAALCAELLVAQMGAEPWPLEASLARQLHSQRLKS
jgi:tRNA 5-methylaminomethyl-2-thiouridine biosynthesis bifunctional protein